MRVLLIETDSSFAERLQSEPRADDHQFQVYDLGEGGLEIARHESIERACHTLLAAFSGTDADRVLQTAGRHGSGIAPAMRIAQPQGDRRLAIKTSKSIEEPLSAREQGILELIGTGFSNKEIARTLGIGPETVKTHVSRIFIKLHVDKRAQAVAVAQDLGLIEVQPLSRPSTSAAESQH